MGQVLFQQIVDICIHNMTYCTYFSWQVIADNMSEDEIAGLKEMFKMIDVDNSGQITLEELKIGLEKVGAILKDSETHQLMQAVSAVTLQYVGMHLFSSS